MTKITKMSLIAALAVAGTTASAQPLAEAIKNVDVSGTVAYRYNDYEDTDAHDTSSSTNNYKIAMNLKSKVNDDVTANMRFIIGGDAGSEASLNTHDEGDANPTVTLSEVNFTYTGISNTSVTIGKQALATPFTMPRDDMGNEQVGTGALAAVNLGPVTLAAAYFNQTNLGGTDNDVEEISNMIGMEGDEDVVFVGAMASFAGINIDASYVDVDDFFDAYTIGLNASYDIGDFNLSPFARYTSLDLDHSSKDNVLWQLGLNASVGIFDAYIAYGETDEEGGTTALDYSAETGMDPHWRVTLTGISDAEALFASVGAQVLPSVNVSLNYSGIDTSSKSQYANGDKVGDLEEYYAKVSYDMSKNFTTYIQFGQYTQDDVDGTKDIDSTIGRLHVQYSF